MVQTPNYDLDIDTSLGGSNASDYVIPSQKAVKDYVDNHGGSASAIDNLSITENSSNELQTVGVINQNATTTAVKTWTGTKAQYDAIVTKDANTLYNITDDTDVSLTILEALYPVGSIYITTADTCPLSALIAGSTWTLVGQDRVLQGAGTRGSVGSTLNESLPNITGTLSGLNGTLSANLSGAFSTSDVTGSAHITSSSGNNAKTLFSASNSNSTYQDNAPVQPDAYLVNIYRRTA